ncbi:MAG: hypothetical protein QXO30_06010 [Candidatus Caldarchaeum sp.]
MKATAILLTILMLAFIQAAHAQEQPQTLTVRALDPDGLPKPGLTVVVEGPGFRETSSTNASGHAVFRQIVPGSYELVLLLQNIELLRTSIRYPETTFMELQAPVSRLTVKVSDLAGRAVENVFVTLNAPTGAVSVSQRTNATGHALFSDVPYSTVSRVGGSYSLRVSKEGVVVAQSSVEVSAGRVFREVVAGLVNVNFTVVSRDGQEAPVDAELVLRAGNYSQSLSVSRGVASVRQLPTSTEVGAYNASLSIRLGARNVVVYSSFLTLQSDASIFLNADVGKLTVKVLDPEGRPVRGVGMLIGTKELGNFTSGVTDENGLHDFGFLPLSSRTGEYNLSLFRGRTRIQVERVVVDQRETVKEVYLRFQRIAVNVYDAGGRPLSGAVVTITDPQTGRSANATTADGASFLNIFPGSNEIQITYKQREVFKRAVELSGEVFTIRLPNVNFPMSVRVVDALGAYAEGLRVVVKLDDEVVVDRLTTSQPISLLVEKPSTLTVDVYRGSELLARERVSAAGSGSVDVRLLAYVYVGGGLVAVDVFVSALLTVVLAVLFLTLVYRLRQSRQR